MDYQGIAILISAFAAATAIIVGQALSVMTFVRQGRVTEAMITLGHSVNGQTVEVKKAIETAALLVGEKIGVAKERANPQVSAATISEVK